MEKLTWLNGNKARIETGHKTFDRQCETLSTGNIWGTCLNGGYIRPRSELECNGRVNPEGHLQDFDLNSFKGLPERIRRFCAAQFQSVILYELRHWGKKLPYGERRKVIHAYIVTLGHEGDHKLLQIFMVKNGQKSWNIANWCKDYISNP